MQVATSCHCTLQDPGNLILHYLRWGQWDGRSHVVPTAPSSMPTTGHYSAA